MILILLKWRVIIKCYEGVKNYQKGQYDPPTIKHKRVIVNAWINTLTDMAANIYKSLERACVTI